MASVNAPVAPGGETATPSWRRPPVALAVALLLACHAALVASAAVLHSPTLDEPAHLVAGLAQWEFGRFGIYSVNPPLVHYAAAIPVIFAGYHADWTSYGGAAGTRGEMTLGQDFVRANGARSAWLITLARWGCLPFTIIGGLACFLWSRELWGGAAAGLISLFFWCFEPFPMGHAELITADCAGSALGLAASYAFWRWLKEPSWQRALVAGTALGLAELAKTTWVVLFAAWPALWLAWVATGLRAGRGAADLPRAGAGAVQVALILGLGVYVLNLGYLFDGTLTRLGDYQFVSRSLAGSAEVGAFGNRFTATWAGRLPMPLPRDYLAGIDLQKRDFEDREEPSFLRGEWKNGGWSGYYVYGIAAKTTFGFQTIVGLGAIAVLRAARARPVPPWPRGVDWRGLMVLLAPGVIVLVLVSSQLRFNHHVRYVLPTLAVAMVFAGSAARWFEPPVSGRSWGNSKRLGTNRTENDNQRHDEASLPGLEPTAFRLNNSPREQ